MSQQLYIRAKCFHSGGTVVLLFFVLFLSARVVHGYTNTTQNISSCGGTLSGGSYTSIGSFSPLGGQGSRSISFCNYSGFAAGFILQPETICSGLPDELNPDNDLDGLSDCDEIVAGTSLYNSDTDGDGMNDPQELVAGTSPTNSASLLDVQLSLSESGNELTWYGVSSRYYQLEYTDDLASGWTPKGTVVCGFDAQIMDIDIATGAKRFYRIRVSDSPSGL